MFNLVGVLLEHSFPASALMAKGWGYGLLRGGWVIPHGSPLCKKKKGENWKEILLKLVKKKKI